MNQTASIRLIGRQIEISHAGDFSANDVDRFLQRAFAHRETDSVRVEPKVRRYRINLLEGDGNIKGSLTKLADLLVHPSVSAESMPEIPSAREAITFRRWRNVVTSLSIEDRASGLVRVMLPRSIQTPIRRETLESLCGLPGIHSLELRRFPRRIRIKHDPEIDPTAWIRALERMLHAPARDIAPVTPPKVPSMMANTNLALCTTGQFLYPPAIPVVSGVLLLSRLPQFTKAARELGRGKVGAPFYGSVVVACSVATMAPFASALAEWLTCQWERRSRKQIVKESSRLIQDIPATSSLQNSTLARLKPGDDVCRDGIVVEGDLLVRDLLFTGPSARILRKRSGDALVSGYKVIGGEGILESGTETVEDRLTSVIQSLAELPAVLAESPSLQSEARSISDLSVYPNLALAGLAYSMGGLHMAGALMHQDWMASPQIAAPTEFFRDLRTALQHGALIRTPEALTGLATSEVLLIAADYPGLREFHPEVSAIESADKSLLRAHEWGLSLAQWVGDGRAVSLKKIALPEGQAALDNTRFIGFESGRTELRIAGHRVILEDVQEEGEWPSLRINVEGEASELIRFTTSTTPRLAHTFGELRALGIATAVYGNGASQVASSIGADAIYPDMDTGTLASLQGEIKRQGYRFSIVAASAEDAELCEDAQVVIGSHRAISGLGTPTIQLLGESLDALPELVIAARKLRPRMGLASLGTIPTNLLCILGAFAGTFNGTMTTAIAHTGVLGVSIIQGRRARKPRR